MSDFVEILTDRPVPLPKVYVVESQLGKHSGLITDRGRARLAAVLERVPPTSGALVLLDGHNLITIPMLQSQIEDIPVENHFATVYNFSGTLTGVMIAGLDYYDPEGNSLTENGIPEGVLAPAFMVANAISQYFLDEAEALGLRIDRTCLFGRMRF